MSTKQQLCQAKFCYRTIRHKIEGFSFCDIHTNNISTKGYVTNLVPDSVLTILLTLKAKKMVEDDTIERFRIENEVENRRGTVVLYTVERTKITECNRGFLRIFPSYTMKDRRDEGYICKGLTPKTLGPVVHGQPGLPIAMTLENFNYGNMCFHRELDIHGEPGTLFKKNRLAFYKRSTVSNYKLDKNEGAPKYFVWVN